MTKQKIPRIPTRRQVARSKREAEQRRLLFIGLGITLGLVALVFAYGLLDRFVIEPGRAVARVDDTVITRGEYRDRVRYERFLLDDQYQQIITQAEQATQGTEDPQLVEFLTSQYQQLANQVLQQRSSVDRSTLDAMLSDVLIAREAESRGITATTADIDAFINQRLAGQEGGVTQVSASETATARAEASATAALFTPTPTLTPEPTPTFSMIIVDPTATPADTPVPAPTPTFNIITTGTLTTAYTNWIARLSNEASLTENTYRDIMGTYVLREKVRDAIGADVPTVAEQTRARHILVETEAEAITVTERLAAGEDFAALAEELSTDTGSAMQGGDLGFVLPGAFVPEFDEVVFSLPVGDISDPVQTDFGWHVIQVTGREERELSPADYQREQQAAFEDWLQAVRAEADIEDLWTIDVPPPDPLFGR